MWLILNSDYKAVGVLDNSLPDGCPYFNDNHKEQLGNGYALLEFEVPSNHDTAKVIEVEGFIVYTDNGKDFELFKIKNVEQSHNEYTLKKVTCEISAVSDLLSEVIRPISFNAQNLRQVMEALLTNTGWELGECYFENLVTVDFKDYPTALEAINNVLQLFEADIHYTVKLKGSKVVQKLVNLYSKRGNDTGVIFEYGDNLAGVVKTENTDQLVTAMIGVGKSDANGLPLTIETAQVAVPEGYERGTDWLGSTEAYNRWGKDGKHIFGVYKDDNATNAVELFHSTLEALKKYSKPLINYEVEVVSLETVTGYDFKRVEVGDRITVKDTTFKPHLYLNARVIEKEKSTTAFENGKVVLGEFKPIFVAPIEIVRKLQAEIRDKEGRWDSAYDKAEDAYEKAEDAFQKAEDAEASVGNKADKDYVDGKLEEAEGELKDYVDSNASKSGNLLRNSDFRNGTTHFTRWGTPYAVDVPNLVDFTKALYINNSVAEYTGVVHNGFVGSPNKYLNKYLTISGITMYANIEGASEQKALMISLYYIYENADGDYVTKESPLYFKGTNTGWKSFSQTIKLDGDGEAVKIRSIRLKLILNGCVGEAWITGVQVEEGARATDWQPHPKDAEDLANGYTDIQVATREVGIPKTAIAPSEPEVDDLWLDTSVTPNRLKRWDGTAWVAITPTELIQLEGQITETQIADNSISTPKLQANSITANEIATGAITTNKIATNAITSDHITAGTINSAHIAVNGLDASIITTGTLSAILLDGVTIVGETANITGNLTVGNELYLGTTLSDSAMKMIKFKRSASIYAPENTSSDLCVSAENFYVTEGNVILGADSGYTVYFNGSVDFSNSSIIWGSNRPTAVFG